MASSVGRYVETVCMVSSAITWPEFAPEDATKEEKERNVNKVEKYFTICNYETLIM